MADSYSGGQGSSGERQSGRSESKRPARRTLLMILLLVAAAAALPSFRELDSALISDDGAALGYVQREGAGPIGLDRSTTCARCAFGAPWSA